MGFINTPYCHRFRFFRHLHPDHCFFCRKIHVLHFLPEKQDMRFPAVLKGCDPDLSVKGILSQVNPSSQLPLRHACYH